MYATSVKPKGFILNNFDGYGASIYSIYECITSHFIKNNRKVHGYKRQLPFDKPLKLV